MAIDVSAAIATSLGLSTPAAASRVSGSSAVRRTIGAPSLETPSALQLSLDSRRDIRIDVTRARQAVATAITAGETIKASLRTLDRLFSTATSGLSASNSDIIDTKESRVSRLVLDSQAGRLLDAIDRLVGKSGVGGANLISSSEDRITVQTTAFGGRLTVRAQPLDTTGLGLSDISARSHAVAVAGRSKISTALEIAADRLDHLRGLQRTLQFDTPTAQVAIEFQNNALFETSVRGGLVNLTA